MRKRMTKAEKLTLEQHMIDELDDHHPQSVRHLYYRMTNPRLKVHVDKTDSGYDKIKDMAKMMRRTGKIPWNYIVDDSRSSSGGDYGTTPEEFVKDFGTGFAKALWADSEYHVEIWCESRSIAAVLRPMSLKYGIEMSPTVGFASDSFIYYGSERMKDELEKGKHVMIIYIGDYDPSGVLIDLDTKKKLMHHISGGSWANFDKTKSDAEQCEEYEDLYNFSFYRIAITEEQIKEYDLPTKNRKETEKRVPDLLRTVEAEAMPVEDMLKITEKMIKRVLNERAFAIHALVEKEQSDQFIRYGKIMEEGYEAFKEKDAEFIADKDDMKEWIDSMIEEDESAKEWSEWDWKHKWEFEKEMRKELEEG